LEGSRKKNASSVVEVSSDAEAHLSTFPRKKGKGANLFCTGRKRIVRGEVEKRRASKLENRKPNALLVRRGGKSLTRWAWGKKEERTVLTGRKPTLLWIVQGAIISQQQQRRSRPSRSLLGKKHSLVMTRGEKERNVQSTWVQKEESVPKKGGVN